MLTLYFKYAVYHVVISVSERYGMLYYPRLIYLALFNFLLDFRKNQQQQMTTFVLILLNFQIV